MSQPMPRSCVKVREHGFTLIELMIVVAIIGLLAAVALPQYQQYTYRARVTEGLALASPYKTAVSEYFTTHNQLPTTAESVGMVDLGASSAASVSSIQVSGTGMITITFRTNVAPAGQNQVTLTPATTTGGVNWTCGGNLSVHLKPRSCI